MTTKLISNIVEQQLPDYIRSENPIFVTFLEKYYEWLEQSNNALGQTQTFYDSTDIDSSNNFYLTEVVKEILPYFPEELLLDKSKFLKHVGEFYRSKGTPNSIKFLFRILFNEEIEIYFPKEQILKPSDGKWVLPLALRVETADPNIFEIEGKRITGVNSKSSAVVEKVIKSVDRQLGIEYIELYVSNVNKLFQTGENVVATLVSTGNLISGNTTTTVSAKLIGSLSEIKIDPKNRGLFYNQYDPELGYAGDPVTIIGGLNPLSPNPIGALATVGSVLKGSVNDIIVDDGGFGFRDPTVNINSSIIDFQGGFTDGILGAEAKARITLLDSRTTRTINVSNISIESFYGSNINSIDNISNTKTINELTTKQSLNLSSISFITIDASGGGYRSRPNTEIYSMYMEELSDTLVISSTTALRGTKVLRDSSQDLRNVFQEGDIVKLFVVNKFEEIRKIANVTSDIITVDKPFENDINNLQVYRVNRRILSDIGSLGRLEITNGGSNYSVGDYLVFESTGRGYGANAQVTEVHSANSGIKKIEFNETSSYVRGGEGYTINDLPTISVDSPGGGTGATIIVREILGDGEDIRLSTTRIGAISTLRVSSFGYDYVSAPTISLRNADLFLNNVTEGQVFVSNTRVYQGQSNVNFSWSAYVDRYFTANNILRVFDYRGVFDRELTIRSFDNLVSGNVTSSLFYGDGRAKATAIFENGLIRYPGIYLNTDGQPSSDKKLQDANKYHNYSYLIKTENDYYKFKKALKEVAHPIGTKTFVVRYVDQEEDVSNNSVETIIVTKKLSTESYNVFAGQNNIFLTNPQVDLNVTTTLVISDPIVTNYGLTTIEENGLVEISENSTWVIEKPFLQTIVDANDTIIIKNLSSTINGTMNITSSSNVVTGNGTSFINDLYDGQTLKIYNPSNNSEYINVTVDYVVNSNSLILVQSVSQSNTNWKANAFFDDVKTATFANNSLLTVDTNFSVNGSFVSIIVQKLR